MKNYKNYLKAYSGVKTVYDAFKDGGIEALTDSLFRNSDNTKKKKTKIVAGPLSDGEYEHEEFY